MLGEVGYSFSETFLLRDLRIARVTVGSGGIAQEGTGDKRSDVGSVSEESRREEINAKSSVDDSPLACVRRRYPL